MKKIHPWEAKDLAGDYEERGFHPTKWEEVTEFDEEGYGWVCTDNGRGFVNQEGYLVIPDDYEMIQYPFFENGYCIAKKEGKLGIFDRKNQEVFPFIYDQLLGDLSAENPKVVVALNGKWEMMDIQRNTILPLEYDDIFSFNDKYIIASKNNKYGLIDYQENIIIDFKWDHLEFVGENYCAGKTVDVFFDKVQLEYEGIYYSDYFKHFTKDYQKIIFGIIDIEGNELFPFISDMVIREFNPQNGRAKIALNYWEHPETDSDELCFIADRNGNKIPFSPTLTQEERNSNFHSRCQQLIWDKAHLEIQT